MRSKNLIQAMILILSLASGPAFAQPVTAPGSPSAQNEGHGATTGLGSSHRFAGMSAARAHCGDNDPVVWSDGAHLTYVAPGGQGYGKPAAKHGFYACKSEADGAGFHAGN